MRLFPRTKNRIMRGMVSFNLGKFLRPQDPHIGNTDFISPNCAVVFILLALIRIPHRIKLSQFLIELRDMYVKTNTYLRYTYK